MKLGSSSALLAAGLVAVGVPVAPATAQNYPTRAIELVVPFNPGGSADGSARPLAESVGKVLGKPMVVENRAGAQSVIGASYVAKANTDGHTLLYTAGGTILTPFLVANMTFDPLKDLTPVAMVATFPYVVIGGPNLPFSDFKGMMAYAKANPGKLSFAASDPVTTANINLLLTALKLDMTVVNYTGGGAVMADLLGGHVSLSMVGAGAYLPHKQAGKIKAIVATSADRIDTLKDIPTLKELGYSDLVIDSFYAITGPKGMDPSAVKALQTALGKALSSPDDPLRKQLVNLGFDVASDLSSEAALKKFTAYSNQMGGVFTKLGIKPQ
jgi:tripartite-type tricarboxylate transporter receptor subunit TctC